MTPSINVSNFVPETSAQMPAAKGFASKSHDPAHPEGFAFERELSGEQQKLSSKSEENNSHSNSLKEKESSEEKKSQEARDKRNEGEADLDNETGGIKHAMHIEMPVLSLVSPEIDHEGQVSVAGEEINISSPNSDVFGQNEAASVTGDESVSLSPVKVSPAETGDEPDSLIPDKVSPAETGDEPDSLNLDKVSSTEGRAEITSVEMEKTVSSVTPQKDGTKPLPRVVQPNEQKVVISLGSHNGTAQFAKEVPVPVSANANSPLRSGDLSSVAKPNEEVVSKGTPATVSEKLSAKKDTVQTNESRYFRTDGSKGKTIQTVGASVASKGNQSKEFQAVPAEQSTASTTSRATQGSESTRNVAVPSLNSGAVPSRSAIGDVQPPAKNSRKLSRKAKSGSRTNDRAAQNKFIQNSSTVGSIAAGAPQGTQSTPGATSAQLNRAAFSQVADIDHATSDASTKESSGRISREEGTGNISLNGNTQRSDVNSTPRSSANLQTFFSRINEGVEQLKADKLSSIQLRMTLEHGQSVRIHLNLRGQNLKTVIFTDSDSLRAAFRDGWDSISRALSEKGIDANELQFSLNDDDGKSSAQDSWEEKDLREKEFTASAMNRGEKRSSIATSNLPSSAPNAKESSANRFTRFA